MDKNLLRPLIDITNTTENGGSNESAGEEYPEYPFDNFAPTLSQCFLIVIAGYLAAKFHLLSAADLRGVSAFATYFAMPGIICVSLADADLPDLKWELLLGLVLGKALVFAVVAGSTLLLTRPRNMATAGMYALFCVQSNDLPVGNPLMSSLYRSIRPHMMKYLFFIPALTLLFFSPISYIMMETHKLETAATGLKPSGRGQRLSILYDPSNTNRKMLRKIASELIKSPVVIATVVGIVLNLVFQAKVPHALHRPINILAATIPGLALSILGFSMLGKERHLLGSGIVVCTVLIAVKMVLTPVVLHHMVMGLSGNDPSSKQLGDFALLYGILSPAAVVFQSGREYRLPLAAMSATLILTSFMCFPLSYVIARLTIIELRDLNDYIPQLRILLVYVSAVSIVCCVYVWCIFLWTKQWNKLPCCYVTYLIFTQVVTSCGIILWNVSDVTHTWTLYGQVVLSSGGELAGYIWTAALAAVLLLQQNCPSVVKNNFVVLLSSAFGLSALITTVLCLLISKNDVKSVVLFGKPRYGYEYLQLTTTTVALALCLVIVGTCIVVYLVKKQKKRLEVPPPVPIAKETDRIEANAFFLTLPEDKENTNIKGLSDVSCRSSAALFEEDDEISCYYQDVLKEEINAKDLVFGQQWTFRLLTLLVLLWLTMAIRLASNFYKLLNSHSNTVLVALEYLQAVLFVGQGIWTFLTFGIDVRTLTMSLIKRWRKLRYGTEDFVLPPFENDDDEIKDVCDQFRAHHYSSCFYQIARERRWKGHHYKDSFWGHQMAAWIIKVGLAKDELEAEQYGQKLLFGRVICHVRNAHNFYDAPYLYFFVKKEPL